MGKKVYEKIKTFKYLFFTEEHMGLNFRNLYKRIRDKLALSVKVQGLDEDPDYRVYSLKGNCWVPMPGVEGIANSC